MRLRHLTLAAPLAGAASLLLSAPLVAQTAPGGTPPAPPAATRELAPAPAAIPDTIVTATRVATPEERVPAAITVITRRDIEERGYQSLAEALTAVPGMNLVPTGGPGAQTSGFVRGNSSRSVLVLIDGVPVNDPSEPNGAFNFGQDLLFDVERIEVLRGPASTLYGSSAMGGVVNLITRRARPGQGFTPYGEIAGGSQATVRGGGGAVGTVGAVDYLLSGNSMSTRGFNAMAPRFDANIPERDGFRGAASAARLGWTPAEGTRLEALFRWRRNVFGLDNVPQDVANYTGTDVRWYGQVSGQTTLLDGGWVTGLRIAATEDERSYSTLLNRFGLPGTTDRFRGQRAEIDWGNTVRLPSLGQLDEGALSFGVLHMGEHADSRAGSPGFQTSVNAMQHTTAGRAAVQYRAFERLDLTAGVRYDTITSGDSAFTWRLGAVLAVPEVNTRFRVAGGTAFNAPSLFQRFGVIPGFFLGNPDLRPERSTGWEIGAETDFALFRQPRFATFGWTFFQSRVRDLINFNAQFDTLVNVGRANIHGAELMLTVRPAPWVEGSLGWTITEAVNADTNTRLPRRPETVISFTGRFAPTPRLVIAPTVLFTGRSPEGPFAAYDNRGQAYPYATTNKAGTVLNLTATYQAMEKVGVFLEARNLTNRPFEPANGFVVPGRSVLVGTRFAL